MSLICEFAETLQGSVYEQLQWAIGALGVENEWHETKSPLKLEYIPTDQRIIFKGADKPKKIKSTKFKTGYGKSLPRCHKFYAEGYKRLLSAVCR